MVAKLSRKERDRERHRREILTAALKLFSRNGFERTTMAEIAEQAEFAVGTLYKFFKDKKTLYRSLILQTVSEFEQAWTAALDGPGTEIERIAHYIDTKALLFAKRLPTARMYFAQTSGAFLQPAAGLDGEARAMYQRVLKALESVLRSGIRKRLFVKADPKMLALSLEGLSNALLSKLVERPGSTTPEEIAEHAKRLFFRSVCLEPYGA